MYVTKYPEIQAAEREHLMPGLVGHKNYHGLGKVVPRLMPFAILALWFALLAFEYLRLR